MTDAARTPRVLVEHADDTVRRSLAELLTAHGLEALACGGPRSLPDGVCPLVCGDVCGLADTADVVFFDLDLGREAEAAVLDALRCTHPQLPIVLEVPTDTALRHARRLDGCTVIPPFDPDRLVAAFVDAASATARSS